MSARAVVCFPALLALALTLTACDPVEEKPGPPGGAAYVAPPPGPPRSAPPAPEVHRWLEASTSVRTQLARLREELSGLQQIHVENHFDNFLQLDPATMDPGQLCYLRHFLERGYFRIERELLLQLLESRRARAATPSSPAAQDIPGRLQAALQRDETLLIDLEAAIARYRSPGDEPFQIPAILTEPQVEALRTTVSGLLNEERKTVASLDQKIRALRGSSAKTAAAP